MQVKKKKVFQFAGIIILFRSNKTRLIFYIFVKDSEEKQERIRKAELEWKEKKIKERRQAQKRLQKKAKKEIDEEKKKIEKRSESSKTFQSWQVRSIIASNIYINKTLFPSALFSIPIWSIYIINGRNLLMTELRPAGRKKGNGSNKKSKNQWKKKKRIEKMLKLRSRRGRKKRISLKKSEEVRQMFTKIGSYMQLISFDT